MRFSAPTEIKTGLGVSGGLKQLLRRQHAPRLALVCDAGIAAGGLIEHVVGGLEQSWLRTSTLVQPDPTFQFVEDAAEKVRGEGADTILAVGGGSALVVGKAIALRVRNPDPLDAYVGVDRAPAPPATVVAIPTTGGSGSEVSDAIVLRDPASVAVAVIRGRGLAPAYALLDGHLLRTLPSEPLLYAALDALSHGFEALWARDASAFTDALALAAVRAIETALGPALDSREPHALQALVEAGAMANLACGCTGLGLVHALSLATAPRLSHGYLNGVLLPHVAAFNHTAGRSVVTTAASMIPELYRQAGFEARFGDAELAKQSAQSMINVALSAPLLQNNPRPADAADLQAILKAAGATI